MFDNFAEYMYYLLTTPFKRIKKSANHWYAFCMVIGKWFDECEKDIYKARTETMAATCSNVLLKIHGDDRKMVRYDGEQLENFRVRICMYEEICQLGGSNQGILLAVKSLGITNPKLVTAANLLGEEDRWAEFYLVLDLELDQTYPIKFDILRKVVRQVKEVGAKDNYLYRFPSSVTHDIQCESRLVIESVYHPHPDRPALILDGSWQMDGSDELCDFISTENYPLLVDGSWGLDGSYRLSGYQLDHYLDLYPLAIEFSAEVPIDTSYQNSLIVERDLWHLDGVEILDGGRSLAADSHTTDL